MARVVKSFHDVRLNAVVLLKVIQVRLQRHRIGQVLMRGHVGDELTLRRNLHIVARLQLPGPHGIFLHPHEHRVFVCLGKAVALA